MSEGGKLAIRANHVQPCESPKGCIPPSMSYYHCCAPTKVNDDILHGVWIIAAKSLTAPSIRAKKAESSSSFGGVSSTCMYPIDFL